MKDFRDIICFMLIKVFGVSKKDIPTLPEFIIILLLGVIALLGIFGGVFAIDALFNH